MAEDNKLILDIQKWLDDQGFQYNERTNELIANSCFNCGRSKKLYINKESGMYNCFRCGVKGNPINLVMNVGNVNFKKALELCYGISDEKVNAVKKLEEDNWEEFFQISSNSKKTNLKIPDPPLELREDFEPIKPTDLEYWGYLRKRGFSDDMILSTPLYVWREKKRIVFTIETNNQIMGYMARDITGQQQPKTLNSRGNFRSFNFWNYDRVKNSETIIICEGIFSAIKCGIDRTIALLGKTLAEGQLKLLRTTNAKKIIICLDPDTDQDQQKMYEELSIYYTGQIYTISLPPVIQLKKEISPSAVEVVNKRFKTNLKILPNLELELLPEDKKVIKNFIRSGKMLILSPEAVELAKYISESDYKDSGDYSFEEMNQYINNAKLFSRF